MASTSRDHYLIKTTKYASKPTLLLKDYLRDDLSSGSSSGFKSFPRRQCCTTVGFHLETDLKLQRKNRNSKLPRRKNQTVLQRASEAVITAIKLLPLSLSSQTKKASTSLLSRSFSRRLLTRRFWKKAEKEQGSEGVPRCRRSFRELLMLEPDYKTTSFNEDTNTIFTTAPSITTVSSDCCSNSWGESEFTFSSNATSYDSSAENYLVDAVKDGVPHQHKIEGVTTTEWSKEKEHLSPISVLDCPFEDEEEMKSHSMINSFFEGAEQKHMQIKTRHFENVASLEPVNLENKWSQFEDEEPHYHSTNQCLMINADNLLFDYFQQSIEENNDFNRSNKLNICKVVEDWIQGKPQEPYLGWEVKEGRHVYINEMDKCGEWKSFDQETEQLVLELENQVLTSLVNEIVIDLAIC